MKTNTIIGLDYPAENDTFNRLYTILECDGETDRRTDGHRRIVYQYIVYDFMTSATGDEISNHDTNGVEPSLASVTLYILQCGVTHPGGVDVFV